MDLSASVLESHLTSLPTEIRLQIYTYLFDSWTLRIECIRAAPETCNADSNSSPAPHNKGLGLEFRAKDFPAASFRICRSIYHDLKALQPLPVGAIEVNCDLASVSTLRARLRKIFEDLNDRVDCLRATKLVVNQDGVYGLDIGLVRGGMMKKLEVVEVRMRDLAVNSQYAAAWIGTALEKEGEVVQCEPGLQCYVSTEYAFGYLHSFLGWELPGSTGSTMISRVRLLARQEVTVWAEKRCVVRLDAIHDIEKRRVLEVQKRSVIDNWRQYFARPKILANSNPVPFFGPGSCVDIDASAGVFKSEAVNVMAG